VREADDPTPDDERRVLAAVYAVAGSSVLMGVGAGASKAKKLVALLVGPGSKLGVVGMCFLAAGVATLSVPRALPPSPVRPVFEPLTKAVGDAVAPPRSAPELRTPSVEARTTPSAPSRVPSLRDEVLFLAEVQAALRRGDGARALELLEQHETTDRQLLAERRAARVHALCAVGRTHEARSAGVAFLREYPTSPQRAAVEGSCAGLEKKERP
jgi:hypothetical protein